MNANDQTFECLLWPANKPVAIKISFMFMLHSLKCCWCFFFFSFVLQDTWMFCNLFSAHTRTYAGAFCLGHAFSVWAELKICTNIMLLLAAAVPVKVSNRCLNGHNIWRHVLVVMRDLSQHFVSFILFNLLDIAGGVPFGGGFFCGKTLQDFPPRHT